MTLAVVRMIQWRLRQVMADRNITNRALAGQIGLHETSVSKLKQRDDMPRVDGGLLDRLCLALNCGPSDLIVYSTDKE
ncbi:helix-turn-helix domain-containing protein [cf. Phormidesmis sp. LEGE 11477]|uniref:helix-turn-helix domain-containing protein n=1 Tax=cf. Phormidesmis sp. LEGE 11477 TaxID=1828680 RepID=UPI00351CED2E